MKLDYNNTECRFHIITGQTGEVTLTKRNAKSIRYEGRVKNLSNDMMIDVSGRATYWKELSDGRTAWKDGKAVITTKTMKRFSFFNKMTHEEDFAMCENIGEAWGMAYEISDRNGWNYDMFAEDVKITEVK